MCSRAGLLTGPFSWIPVVTQSLIQLRATWRIVVAKPRQVQRLLLAPFLLAVAVKAWLSVQATGQVWPEIAPGAPIRQDLVVRGSLGLALAIMGLLWHRAIFFGVRAPLTARFASRYWVQGAGLSIMALAPFVPFAFGYGAAPAVFSADALALWLLLWLGYGLTRAAGGARQTWRDVLDRAQAGVAALFALGLAVVLQLQGASVAVLVPLHGGAAFLLDGAITFALIVVVLTLMARPPSRT